MNLNLNLNSELLLQSPQRHQPMSVVEYNLPQYPAEKPQEKMTGSNDRVGPSVRL